jgi:hypothetical protein
MKKVIRLDLEKLFEHFGRHYSVNPDPYRAASVIVGLVGVFAAGVDSIPDIVHEEVRKIEDALPLFHKLEKLSGLCGFDRHVITWDPEFQRERNIKNLTFNSDFHFPARDLPSVIDAVNQTTEEIRGLKLNYSRLIAWIVERAKAEGYMSDDDDLVD